MSTFSHNFINVTKADEFCLVYEPWVYYYIFETTIILKSFFYEVFKKVYYLFKYSIILEFLFNL